MFRHSVSLWHVGALAMLVAVAAHLAPHNDYFLPNFAWYCLPGAVVLGVGLSFRVHGAVLAGSAAALAGSFLAYSAWATAEKVHGAWLGYALVVPGACAGLFVGEYLARREKSGAALQFAIAAAATTAGLALNVGALYATTL